MIISTKIWKSCNYRGFILLFVHPAQIFNFLWVLNCILWSQIALVTCLIFPFYIWTKQNCFRACKDCALHPWFTLKQLLKLIYNLTTCRRWESFFGVKLYLIYKWVSFNYSSSFMWRTIPSFEFSIKLTIWSMCSLLGICSRILIMVSSILKLPA